MRSCQNNVTNVGVKAEAMQKDFSGKSKNVADGLNNLQGLLYSGSVSVFYCYYSVVDPTGFISNQVNPFALKTILWNILYSLGYFYTDTVNIVKQFSTGTDNPTVLGHNFGDAAIRPLYSHYLDRYT
jgi:hypothetical protein